MILPIVGFMTELRVLSANGTTRLSLTLQVAANLVYSKTWAVKPSDPTLTLW